MIIHPEIKTVYLAHAVAGDVAGNIIDAKWWFGWLVHEYPHIAISAPWITYCEVLDDEIVEHRLRGTRDDITLMILCDAIALTGNRISGGMERERVAMVKRDKPVYDFTTEIEQRSFLNWGATQ